MKDTFAAQCFRGPETRQKRNVTCTSPSANVAESAHRAIGFLTFKEIDVQALEMRMSCDGTLPRMILEDGSAPFLLQTRADGKTFRQP